MMKRSVQLISAMLLLLTAAGCVLTPRSSRQTAYYDLAIPQADTSVDFLKIAAVNNDTPAQGRMIFRTRNNRIEQDGLNCWIQPPERILQRYLTQRFQTAKSAPGKSLTVRCTINAFEFDMVRNEAVLSVKCLFSKNNQSQTAVLTAREKITGKTPPELAAAMNKAVESIAEKLTAAAREINR